MTKLIVALHNLGMRPKKTAATPELATFNYKSANLTPRLWRNVGCTGQKIAPSNGEKLTVDFVCNF
jgi:hypothetical protein